jgi:hypothetical protein
MRLRFAVPAAVVGMLSAAAMPAAAVAAPVHNHGLTINATPNPSVTGDPVLIYGQLNLPHPGNRLIVLYHRINPAPFFTVIQTTRTLANGFYEFSRADGIVTTNRNWFVVGPNGTHSRTIHEKVAATISLSASATSGDTNHPLTFTGTVAPDHAGQRVRLQELSGDAGGGWRTIKTGILDGTSSFSINYDFRQPGDYELRAVFPADARNIEADSTPNVDVSIQQTQNPHFTIAATPSSGIIAVGNPVTISGVLYAPGSTTTPEPSTSVTLWGHTASGTYAAIASTVTGTDGSYSFMQAPEHNTVYVVRTTLAPLRMTAQLFVGVQDVVSITDTSTDLIVGGSVTFTGGVTPDKFGHVIYLQKQAPDGDWQNVEASTVSAISTYKFTWTFAYQGTKMFRVWIPGGYSNVGALSSTVSIPVTLPPVTSLPPAS